MFGLFKSSTNRANQCCVYFVKVRTGGQVQNEDILAFGKLFNDELTLDNISRCICL